MFICLKKGETISSLLNVSPERYLKNKKNCSAVNALYGNPALPRHIGMVFGQTTLHKQQLLRLVGERTGCGGGGGVVPYVGYIGMCGPKGYGFLAILV